jgi:hypothetical protein
MCEGGCERGRTRARERGREEERANTTEREGGSGLGVGLLGKVRGVLFRV